MNIENKKNNIRPSMKITAGLGSIDEYLPYIRAGADELFCGYVPAEFAERYGLLLPINRREVRYYNVQIGSESELQILRRMIDRYHVPVTITLNALFYAPEQYPVVAELIERLIPLGFDSFIIADFGLLVYLKEQGISDRIHIHVSGELGEMNHYTAEQLKALGAERLIFHRKVTINDMKTILDQSQMVGEAFLMNERCHFTGAYCNTLHCDELTHMCLVPYRSDSTETIVPAAYIPGASGCGLCALPSLENAGISNLKIVSRGGRIDETIADIQATRTALDILAGSASVEDYLLELKKQVFPNGCGKTCYYQDNVV